MKFLILLFFLGTTTGFAKDIETNSVIVKNSPSWLTSARINKVVDRISRYLEWDIRRVSAHWYTDETAFRQAHGFDSSVLAVAKRADNSVHVGPRVNTENFDGIFGHELVHVILYQKYHDAIPKWLEEGLANYMAKHGTIDYAWLVKQPQFDVRAMGHPFGKTAVTTVKNHYMASTALMEMIASKCSIHDLLQLSVGEKLESYLSTFCDISDLNASYRKWIERKAR